MTRKKKTTKYKLKTHKGTAKRFRMTGTGKIMRTKGGQGHFRRRTSKRTKRKFSSMLEVQGKGYIKRIRRLAPYMGKYRANPNSKTTK